jgi:two-component system response regulator DesR
MTHAPTRCVVADDHPALLTVLTAYLVEHEYDVLAAVPDGRRAVDAATAEQPDVVVLDYRMPYLEGASLIRALAVACPTAKLVVYTADADGHLWEEVRKAGASALLLKEAPLADIRRAIDAVRAGHTYLDAKVAALAFAGAKPSISLTAREGEVLALLAEGLSHEQIGARLAISSETVRTHVRKACDRLGAATRTQAVATALRLRLIS